MAHIGWRLARQGFLVATGGGPGAMEAANLGAASPMVFVDEHYWTEEKPVYPLLHTLAADTPYADELHVTDDVDTVAAVIADHADSRAG